VKSGTSSGEKPGYGSVAGERRISSSTVKGGKGSSNSLLYFLHSIREANTRNTGSGS